MPLNDTHAKQIAWVRCQIWDLYADLKAYKTDPRLQNPTFQEEIRQRFRELCRTRTTYQTPNGHLKRLLASQDELLRVLEDPRLPLHNNLSERDIREYVKRRKISGSTRSDEGRRCRDTFTSLKKTCRKLGIYFWQYLRDRVSRSNAIAPLGEAVRAQARRGARDAQRDIQVPLAPSPSRRVAKGPRHVLRPPRRGTTRRAMAPTNDLTPRCERRLRCASPSGRLAQPALAWLPRAPRLGASRLPCLVAGEWRSVPGSGLCSGLLARGRNGASVLVTGLSCGHGEKPTRSAYRFERSRITPAV